MTTFVIDAQVAVDLAAGGARIPPEHSLAAPTLLRSQALALVYELVHRGEIEERTGRKVLDDIRGLRIRLLGDRSLQDQAWRIAARLNWPDTYQAEYIALTAERLPDGMFEWRLAALPVEIDAACPTAAETLVRS